MKSSNRSDIQSILFEKEYWKLMDARIWLSEHGFTHLDVDTANKFYRFRQEEPDKFKYFRNKKNDKDHLEFIIGFY